MRPLLSLSVLLLGVGSGWFLSPFGEGTGKSPPIDRSTTEPPGATDAEAIATLLERAATSLPEERSSASGAVSGRILTMSDAPVEGVALIFTPLPPPLPSLEVDRAGAAPAVVALREEIALHRDRQRHTREVVSGADGSFRCGALPLGTRGTIDLRAGQAWFLTPTGRDRIYAVGEEFTLRSFEAAEVMISVLGVTGEFLQHATLEISGTRFGTATRDFDLDHPTQWLPLDALEIVAVDGAGRRSDPVAITPVRGEVSDVELQIESPREVVFEWRGVTDPIDRIGLEATVVPLGEERIIIDDPFASLSHRSRALPERLSLEPGAFELIVERMGAPVLTQAFELFDRSVTLTVEVPPVDRADVVSVEVMTEEGIALEAVAFTVYAALVRTGKSAAAPEERAVPFGAISLGDGMHQLIVPASDRPPTGSSTPWERVGTVLEGHDRELGRARIGIEPGSGRMHALIFTTPAYATIELAGYVGHALQGGLYVSYGAGLDPKSWQTCFPDPLGRVQVGPFPPGPMQFSISSRGNPSMNQTFPLTLRSGPNHLSIALPRVYTLEVHFPEHAIGSEVLAIEAGGSLGRTTRIESDGVARFFGLRAGVYVVSPVLDHDGMQIEVPAPARSTYVGSTPNGLLVQFNFRAGEGSGFEANDIIFGVNGREYADLRELEQALSRALASPPATIQLERRGVVVEVSLSEGVVRRRDWTLTPALRVGER